MVGRGFRSFFLNYNYLFVFLCIDDIVNATVLVNLTDSGVGFLDFVLALDIFLNLLIFYDGNLSQFHSVEEFFLENFGFLLFDTLGLFFFSFLFGSFGHHYNHCLLGLVFGTGFHRFNHGVYKESQSKKECDEDNHSDHGLVVAAIRRLTELVSTEFFVLAFKDKVAPFF